MNQAAANPKSKLKSSKRLQPVFTDTAKGWVEVLRIVALVVFLAIPLIGFLLPSYTGRIVWTIAVASLPLFIVLVGFHRWRKICPLAFFATLPWRLGFAGSRRFPREYEGLYYYICFGIFVFSLWMRLIATNGSGIAIAFFFLAISAAAFLVGVLFTGKTWCNYLCPVSFVEKIYTEPHGLRETSNSQCAKCTACKKACPDINQENGYWKELLLSSKRLVYYSFPGVVFGFYFYYFLQSGTWEYYFDGSWVDEPLPLARLFLPGTDATTQGLYFMPSVPRGLASIATLIGCGIVSFAFFSLVEKLLSAGNSVGNATEAVGDHDSASSQEQVRHWMFTLTAFSAFVTFYSFAGAPSIAKLPTGSRQLFQIAFVLTGTMFLVRRMKRNQQQFAEETLAKNILKRWKWKDVQPPSDLREAFLLNRFRTEQLDRESNRVIDLYKDAVREAVQNGLVSREEVSLLQSLRDKLQISDAQHEQVMLELSEEDRGALTEQFEASSAEKQLQLESYAESLSNHFSMALGPGSEFDNRAVADLRKTYRISETEHAQVLERLLGEGSEFSEKLNADVRRIESISLVEQMLSVEPTASRRLLIRILRRTRERAVDRMLRGLVAADTDGRTIEHWRTAMDSETGTLPLEVIDQWQDMPSGAMHRRLATAWQNMVQLRESFPPLESMLVEMTQLPDPYARAASLYELHRMDDLTTSMLDRLAADANELVRETATGLKQRTIVDDQADREVLDIEKMIALGSLPMLESLELTELAMISEQTTVENYAAGEILCRQGEPGGDVFIIQTGQVDVFREENGVETKVAQSGEMVLFGEMAVLDPAPRSATIKASATGAQVLKLAGTAFRRVIDQNPEIAFPVIRSLVRKIRGSS